MGFIKSFPPKKKFFKMPVPHFTHKNLAQANFYVVSKFAEHLQHFNDIFLTKSTRQNFLKVMFSL